MTGQGFRATLSGRALRRTPVKCADTSGHEAALAAVAQHVASLRRGGSMVPHAFARRSSCVLSRSVVHLAQPAWTYYFWTASPPLEARKTFLNPDLFVWRSKALSLMVKACAK